MPEDDDPKEEADNAPKKRRKRRKRRKSGHMLLPYLIIPRWRRVSKKTLSKLNEENARYKVSRAIDAVKVIERIAKPDLDKVLHPAKLEEKEWKKDQQKNINRPFSEVVLREEKIARIQEREEKRRQRVENYLNAELQRKRYRVHPHDPNYVYQEGYGKVRHRITKKRFMKCIDVSLLKGVLLQNKELMESPLWDEDLNLRSLPRTEVQRIKYHLYQFDVIVETLKQGLFDLPESNQLPLDKIRRKRTTDVRPSDPFATDLQWLSKYKTLYKKGSKKSNAQIKTINLKRKMGFPPWQTLRKSETESQQRMSEQKVSSWISKQSGNTIPSKPSGNLRAKFGSLMRTSFARMASLTSLGGESQTPEVSQKHAKSLRRRASLKTGRDFPESLIERMSKTYVNPFSNFLTIQVPKSLVKRKELVESIVTAKVKKSHKRHQGAQDPDEMANELEQRIERNERRDPFQRLHPDERDSDVWTWTTTTTTDDYASWRRAPKIPNTRNQDHDKKQDRMFLWRLILMSIVIWEVLLFVKGVIDEIYYSFLTFHLFRENIWTVETRNGINDSCRLLAEKVNRLLKRKYILQRKLLFECLDTTSPEETYFSDSLEKWCHTIISFLSLSIIQKQNECVSLLFAFSLLVHGFFDIAAEVQDNLFNPVDPNWKMLTWIFVQLVSKTVKISLFLAYHYYSADYIRKAREFRLRKTKLHNHEINAKGTKGLMKRRLAWNWMTGHARKQTLKGLKRKYPDVKDGKFPEEGLAGEIKFVEDKELRLYAQHHSLKLGYPYNSLKDMKRFVFGEIEKSDYTEDDEEERRSVFAIKSKLLERRRSSGALTVDRWQNWKDKQ